MQYKVFNRVIVLFLIYIICVPLLLNAIRSDSIQIPLCQYKIITGEPCPFCGINTDITKMIFGQACSPHNPLTIPFIVCVLLELILRLVVSLKIKEQYLARLIKPDLAIHSILLIALAAYILKTW